MTNLPEKMQYATQMAASTLLPAAYRRNPANVLVACEYGEALGFSAIQAMNLIHVIDGKPTLSAGAIGGLVRKAGHRLRVQFDRASMTARAQIIRADDPDWVFESVWTMDRARAANLVNKQVWKAYPDAMLKARAITEVARDACPEALFGVVYTAEELGAEQVDEDGGAINVTVVGHNPITERTVKDAFLEACAANGIDPAEVYELVGDDDINDDNVQNFRHAVKSILAERAQVSAGSPSDQGEGEAAPPVGAHPETDGVNNDDSVEASPLPSFSDGWMVPVCTDDRRTVPLSAQQRAGLMALSSAVFGKDREARLRWSSDAAGRPVDSFNELTDWEAEHMLVRLGEMKGEA